MLRLQGPWQLRNHLKSPRSRVPRVVRVPPVQQQMLPVLRQGRRLRRQPRLLQRQGMAHQCASMLF